MIRISYLSQHQSPCKTLTFEFLDTEDRNRETALKTITVEESASPEDTFCNPGSIFSIRHAVVKNYLDDVLRSQHNCNLLQSATCSSDQAQYFYGVPLEKLREAWKQIKKFIDELIMIHEDYHETTTTMSLVSKIHESCGIKLEYPEFLDAAATFLKLFPEQQLSAFITDPRIVSVYSATSTQEEFQEALQSIMTSASKKSHRI